MELKHILARQPGPEAAEQLHIYRHTLQEKTKQLKVSGSLCAFLAEDGHILGDTLDKSFALAQRAGLANGHVPPRSAFFSTVVPEGAGQASELYSSAPRLIDPMILPFLKERGEQAKKELGRE